MALVVHVTDVSYLTGHGTSQRGRPLLSLPHSATCPHSVVPGSACCRGGDSLSALSLLSAQSVIPTAVFRLNLLFMILSRHDSCAAFDSSRTGENPPYGMNRGGGGNEVEGLMTFCHDARKGRHIGSHWPNHVRASAPLDLSGWRQDSSQLANICPIAPCPAI